MMQQSVLLAVGMLNISVVMGKYFVYIIYMIQEAFTQSASKYCKDTWGIFASPLTLPRSTAIVLG